MPAQDHEYKMLDAIAQDATVTQSSLAAQLGVAVGSVNWYIKRLISKGYVKVARMERTRLKYHLTPEGAKALARRTGEYMEYSLEVYRRLRKSATECVQDLQTRGIREVALIGEGDPADILRLTCIEHGVAIGDGNAAWAIRSLGSGYEITTKAQRHKGTKKARNELCPDLRAG